MLNTETIFPYLDGSEATLETLHRYCKAVDAIPRAHALVQPRWEHLGLSIFSKGFETTSMSLPGGGTFSVIMDLTEHRTILKTSSGESIFVEMAAGLSEKEFGERVIRAVAELGLDGKYDREKFSDDEPCEYDPQSAEQYLIVLKQIDRIFKKRRAMLSGECSPVLLWPHGFDLGFVWFGTRIVTYEENGNILRAPAQLNLGFSPGEPSQSKPYFYSNPWPFEKDKLVDHLLPAGASWFSAGWNGSLLPYRELVNDIHAESRLLEYAQAVFEIAAPSLMA